MILKKMQFILKIRVRIVATHTKKYSNNQIKINNYESGHSGKTRQIHCC